MTMSYGDTFLNKNVIRGISSGILIDEVVPRPDLTTFDVQRKRETPLRMVFGSKEDFLRIINNIKNNSDKYIFIDDPYEADKLVFQLY